MDYEVKIKDSWPKDKAEKYGLTITRQWQKIPKELAERLKGVGIFDVREVLTVTVSIGDDKQPTGIYAGKLEIPQTLEKQNPAINENPQEKIGGTDAEAVLGQEDSSLEPTQENEQLKEIKRRGFNKRRP